MNEDQHEEIADDDLENVEERLHHVGGTTHPGPGNI